MKVNSFTAPFIKIRRKEAVLASLRRIFISQEVFREIKNEEECVYDGRNYECGKRTGFWRLVFNRRGAGILDAGWFCDGGGRLYQSQEYRKHSDEESDGFLHRYSSFHFNRFWASAWRGHGWTDWKAGTGYFYKLCGI